MSLALVVLEQLADQVHLKQSVEEEVHRSRRLKESQAEAEWKLFVHLWLPGIDDDLTLDERPDIAGQAVEGILHPVLERDRRKRRACRCTVAPGAAATPSRKHLQALIGRMNCFHLSWEAAEGDVL